MAINIETKSAKYDNHEVIQDAYLTKASYVDTTLNTAKDPFASKTNKYAETDLVIITAMDKAIWVRWSAAGTAAVANTDNNICILADQVRKFVVNKDAKYLRIIEDAASATSIVEEIG